MNNTIDNVCVDEKIASNDEDCGALYNGMVAPFINMSMKGILWYQGENNVAEGDGGDWRTHTGYSCMQKLMIEQWRSQWNNEQCPFGIVQLVAGTDEGYHSNMAHFRFAQQFNTNLLPHSVVPNTFIAMGYDLGDPWSPGCVNVGTCVDRTAAYNVNDTPWVIGPIHARPKVCALCIHSLLFCDMKCIS